VMATQLAARVATSGEYRVALAVQRDPLTLTWERLLAAAGGLQLRLPGQVEWSGRGAQELQAGIDSMSSSQLWIVTSADELPVRTAEQSRALDSVRLLVIDDVQRVASAGTAASLAQWARGHQATVVVTATLEEIAVRSPLVPYGIGLSTEWREHVDYATELRWLDQDSHPGEVKLAGFRHRWGPVCHTGLAFNGFHAEFIDRSP
jgi:hypothetical protein